MSKNHTTASVLIITLLLSACTSSPTGPSAMALPGTGKDFDQFRADDSNCRQYAREQVGGTTANQSSNDSFAKTAVLGTALGAAVGAAAGGGRGAGVGAATGLLVGSLIGVDEADMSSYGTQRRYDNVYVQCMYSKGNQIPGIVTQPTRRYAPSYPPPGIGY